MIELLVKWLAGAFLLGFAWAFRRVERRRATGLLLAALGLLAFEVGIEESLLELACAALLVHELARRPASDRALVGAGVIPVGLGLVYFALRPWVALLRPAAGNG